MDKPWRHYAKRNKSGGFTQNLNKNKLIERKTRLCDYQRGEGEEKEGGQRYKPSRYKINKCYGCNAKR